MTSPFGPKLNPSKSFSSSISERSMKSSSLPGPDLGLTTDFVADLSSPFKISFNSLSATPDSLVAS